MTMKIALRTKVLIGAAALVAAYVVFMPAEPTAAEASDSGRPAAGKRAQAAHATPGREASAAEALALFAHRVADATSSASLFAAHSWYVAPPPPPPPPPTASLAPPKPTAPPLPYQFMGSYAHAGEPTVVFLTRGDVVLDVHVGDTLENTYSVDKLEGGQLYLTYKPLNIQQQLNAGGSQ
jgi:hypothetical protein